MIYSLSAAPAHTPDTIFGTRAAIVGTDEARLQPGMTTERSMHRTAKETADHGCDRLLALDWSSLGRLVRTSTLDAVALHFAALMDSTGVCAHEGSTSDVRDWSER